jgi:hypothetical protein
MATYITNKLRSTSIIRVVEDPFIGSTIKANIALTDLRTSNNEVVTAASIKGVVWSTYANSGATANGAVSVIRDNQVVLSVQGNGEMRLDDFAYSISDNASSTIEITSNNSRGTFILEITKESTFTEPLIGM